MLTKTVIGKKSDAHDSKESPRFASRLKKLYHNFDLKIKTPRHYLILKIEWSVFIKPWVPFAQGFFVPSLVEIGSVILKGKIFKFPHCMFAVSLISLFGKGRGPFFLTNLNSHHLLDCIGCFVPSLYKIGSVLLEYIFFKFFNVFSLFRNYLPLEKGVAFHLNKLESPLSKDALSQVWLKLDRWFWRRFLNFVIIYPLEQGLGH